MIFLEADLSQSEGRMVLALTNDRKLVELARTKPWEFDMHVHNAALIFGQTPEELLSWKKTRREEYERRRYLGKRAVHGAQRDMHGGRLSQLLLMDGHVVTPEACDKLISQYHARVPAIKDWFREIRKLVMRDKMLVNSWGRRIDFRYDRLDDELFRQAYSFLPQSENADLLNQWGLKPTYYFVKALLNRPPNVQVHDSLLVSVPPAYAWEVAEFIRDNLERPRLYAGNELSIPVEFKLGVNWGADEKSGEGVGFKRLPSRREFEDVAFALADKRAMLDRAMREERGGEA